MKKKVFILISILVLVVGIGISYAYFSAVINSSESISSLGLNSGELRIDVSGGSNIITENINPSDTPFAVKEVNVKGTNSTNLNMAYKLKIVVDNNTYTTNSIKYSLESTNTNNNGKTIENISMRDLNTTTEIGIGYFSKGSNKNHDYTIRFYFPDDDTDQSENMGAIFSAHIEIEGIRSDEGTPIYWNAAPSGTLLYAIRNKYTVSEPVTTPGVDISLENEAVLASTPDDYGTSYYFRGKIQDNYVLFAKKCWRIVRITGDGSIKLFLWNNANSCTSTSNAYDTTPFNPTTKLDENNNTVYNYATGVGFMYGHSVPTGETNTEKYLDAQANITDSYILTKLKEWYIATFNTQTLQDKLSDTIWCGDKSLRSGLGYGQTYMEFNTTKRIVTLKSPTLICPAAGDGKLSKYTAYDTTNGNGALIGYKIGLITADEVAFAGGVFNIANNNYFLYTGVTYWTMSPNYYSSPNASMWLVDNTGYLGGRYVRTGDNVRPAVSLIPQVTISSGNGEASTPYVIS